MQQIGSHDCGILLLEPHALADLAAQDTDGLVRARSISQVMAGLVPAIHVLT